MGTFPHGPAAASPVKRPPLTLRGGIVPAAKSAYGEPLSTGRADAIDLSDAHEKADMAIVRFSLADFEQYRHGRTDSAITAAVALASQNSDHVPGTYEHRSAGTNTHASRGWHGGRGGRGRTRHHTRGPVIGGTSAFSTTAGRQGSGPETKWRSRRAHTLLGLCNRCSPQTVSGALPLFEDAMRSAANVRLGVATIMHSLAISDDYVEVFVVVLEHLRSVGEGVDQAVSDYAAEFLQGSAAFEGGTTPDPLNDYDAFCASVKDRRCRANCTAALAKLGFGSSIAERAHDALAVIADPNGPVQKDLAIRFVAIALPHADVAVAASVRERAAQLLRRPATHGLDSRTQFALMDALESSVWHGHVRRKR